MRKLVLFVLGFLCISAFSQPTSFSTSTIDPNYTKPIVDRQVVLWEQAISTVNTDVFANQDFEASLDDFDMYIADDIDTAGMQWTVERVFVDGNTWNPGTNLTCATMLNFAIYADASGQPAGYPGGGAAPVWSISLAPTDTQITLSNGIGGYQSNVLLTLTSPALLAPGIYWVVFYPTMEFGTCGQYGRHVSDTTNGADAMVINPGGGFGFPATWTPITDASTWGSAQQDVAFRIDGIESAPIPTLSPWMMVVLAVLLLGAALFLIRRTVTKRA